MLISNFKISEKEINEFADISGDWNPIHIDKEVARRFKTGEPIVHGIYTLLKILEIYSKNRRHNLVSINCIFKKPILAGDKLLLELHQKGPFIDNLFLYKGSDLCLSLQIVFNLQIKKISSEISYQKPLKSHPRNLEFDELNGMSGSLVLEGDLEKLKGCFVNLFSILDARSILAITNTSRLVGMITPGLNSIYSSLNVNFNNDLGNNRFEWKVINPLSMKLPFNINFYSPGINCNIQVFYRSKPVQQPSIEKLIKFSRKGKKLNKNVLIIGGNRGLGEVFAKMLALEGARIMLTYNRCCKDAFNVVNEINKKGLLASCYNLDILDQDSIQELICNINYLDEIYYFASPKIIKRNTKNFDLDLFRKYSSFYVDAYLFLIKILQNKFKNKISVFYPSTIFLNNKQNNDFEEYKLSKLLGEKISEYFNNNSDKFKITYPRIPVLLTDQTVDNAGFIESDVVKSVASLIKLID